MKKPEQNQMTIKDSGIEQNDKHSWHPPEHRRIFAKATEGKTYYWTSETTTSYNVS